MGYYSDPTAAMALGRINREFSKHEKRAKQICKLFKEGKISEKELQKAQAQFSGIYKHVLTYALEEEESTDDSVDSFSS